VMSSALTCDPDLPAPAHVQHRVGEATALEYR